MKRHTVNLPTEISKLVKADAAQQGVSISAFFAQILDNHYDGDDRYATATQEIAQNPHYGWYNKTLNRSAVTRDAIQKKK